MPRLHNYREFIDNTRYDPTISRLTKSLWPHQKSMLEFALSRDSALLYSGMGTGKTAVGLVYLEHFDGLRLVLCPKPALNVWKADYEAFYDDKPYELHIIDGTLGTAKDKERYIEELYQRNVQAVVVVNYDTASMLPIQRWKFSAVFADEVHRLASFDGKQSRTLALSCKNIPYKVGASGTVVNDGYERLYGICRWLDPLIPSSARAYPQARIFGHYNDFLDSYCVTYQKGYTRIIRGYKNLKTLADIITPFTMLIKTEDVINLPNAAYRHYSVEMSDKLAKVYKSLEEEGAIEVGDDFIIAPHVLTRLIRLQQLVTSGVLVTEEGKEVQYDISSREQAFGDILDDIGDEPIVIFCRYKRDVEIVSRIIREKYNEDVAQLTGDVDTHEEWKEGKYRVLVCNLASGSEAVRLTRAKHVVYYGVGYSDKNWRQSHARVRRYGQQSDTVYFHYLTTKNSVDEDIYKILDRKTREVDSLDREIA